jgi:hypothetical protein
MEKMPASITEGTMSTWALARRRIMMLREKAVGTPRARKFPRLRPWSSPSENMRMIPKRATLIAAHVREGIRSVRKSFPKRATKKGPVLMSTKVLATVFRVTERIKKKNVEARKSPHRAPWKPTAAILEKTLRRCQMARTVKRKKTIKTERHSTISQESGVDTFRTRIPPVLQQIPAPIMSRRPRRWWAESALPATSAVDAGEEGVIALAAEFLFIVFSDRKIFLKISL